MNLKKKLRASLGGVPVKHPNVHREIPVAMSREKLREVRVLALSMI
ncbi:MAG: hypothetical protein AAGA18_11205 [Verrucomicrobiota bacterium]